VKKKGLQLPACIRVYGQPYVDIYFINYLAKRLAEQTGQNEDAVKENITNLLVEYSKEKEEIK
jgi:hypothetical protein